MPGEGGCTGTCPPRMGTRDYQGAPVQRTAQVSHSRGEDLHRRLQEGNLLQIRHPTKLDLSLEKVSTDAGVRLRNLKRRRGFDANILPRKRPALSDADRQSKVKEIDRQCTMMVVLSFGQNCLCWQGLSFTGARSRGGRSETCSPCWPDGAPSSGPSFLFVFCKKIDRPCTMVVLTTREL